MVVHIVKTGIANTASVAAAIARCGAEPALTTDPTAVETAERLVLPGVGSFGAGMTALRYCGLDAVIRDRVLAGRPTLAVCLGLQLLCAESDESPGERGLGVIDTPVRRFPAGARVPQFGWNRVNVTDAEAPIETGHAYFANSYRVERAPEGWGCATTEHAGPFVSAIWRGGVLACQFHPELSGAWGARLLSRWVGAREGAPSC